MIHNDMWHSMWQNSVPTAVTVTTTSTAKIATAVIITKNDSLYIIYVHICMIMFSLQVVGLGIFSVPSLYSVVSDVLMGDGSKW